MLKVHFLIFVFATTFIASPKAADDDPQFLTLEAERRCVQFTVNADDYDQSTDNGQLRVKSSGVVIEPNDYVVSLEDRSAHVCYPLSDSLEQCVNRTKVDQFDVQSYMQLVTHSGMRRPLGAYYLTPKGDAVICNDDHHPFEQPSRKSKRQCNYILLRPGEYRIGDGGRLHLQFSNEQLWLSTNYTLDPLTHTVNACYPLTQEFLNCSSWWILEKREIVILPDKRLLSKPHQETYGPGDYFLIDGGRAVTCIGDRADGTIGEAHRIVIAVIQILSVICLAAAIVVHLLLPDLSYQRAPLLCHAVSLLVTYICLAIRGLITPTLHEDECYCLFYFTYYAAVAAFCWLSVLAFDLWQISRSLRSGTKPYPWVNHFDNRKFLFYSAVGWGVPALLTVSVTLVDYHEHVQDELDLYPHIAATCWFNERPSAFAFFYGPICSLLAANFILFGLAVHNIWFADRHGEFTNRKLNKQLLVICFVVHLTMGLFWIMEVVSYSTPVDDLSWIVPDFINALQGVVVAAVYTCRPLTWRLLKEKFAAESKD